jgi:outer membrane protein
MKAARNSLITFWMVVLTFSSPPLLAQQSLTLEEAIATGQRNNKALQLSSAKVTAATAKASEMSTMLLPSIKLSAGYQRLSDVEPFQVTVPFVPQPIVIAPTVLNNYTTRIALQQPLFTGFKLESNAAAADHLARASELDYALDKADLTLAITTAYWTLYQTLEAKRLIDENVVRLQAIEQDTRYLLKAGMATRNDLLRVQLQLNTAQLSQIDAANDVQLAMMHLNSIIGLPLETELQLTSRPLFPADPEAKVFRLEEKERTVRSLTEKALASRADVLAMQSRVEAARASVRAARGSGWPQLFLSAGYTYARPNLRYQPTRDEFKGTWDLGVQLQFDVWNWGATGDQTDQAEATLLQSELMYEQLKDNITLDVKRQWLAVHRATEKVRVASLAIEQAEENQRTMNDKYRQGLATSTDLLDATVALLQARTNYSAALVEHEIAGARLRRAVGSADAP